MKKRVDTAEKMGSWLGVAPLVRDAAIAILQAGRLELADSLVAYVKSLERLAFVHYLPDAEKMAHVLPKKPARPRRR